jgi:hypothetical protein
VPNQVHFALQVQLCVGMITLLCFCEGRSHQLVALNKWKFKIILNPFIWVGIGCPLTVSLLPLM